MRHRLSLSAITTLTLLALVLAGLPWPLARGAPAAATYYVSNDGDDEDDGLSPETALATVAKVNSLSLGPGDQVLFRCGDVWRADMLVITQSGAEGAPITFGSYPQDCADQPLLSGARPIGGWTPHSGAIYAADLSAGENAGQFPLGVNQLFRDGQRLRLGRWPNPDDPASDNGYATIDGQPAGDRITDDQLPAGDWTGARVHVRGMRWYILNREVVGSNGSTLSLNAGADCWGGDCSGWGYFLNHHLGTLDQDGEWYYDAASHRLYLYATGGTPSGIEGSVVLKEDDRSWGGIVLGEDLGDHITDVTIENLRVEGWFRHGIATPTNLRDHENSRLIIRNNTIRDVDGKGINLATWVYDAQDGQNGWRGGSQIEVRDNLIERANHRGIDSYAKYSTIQGNTIRDVALTDNLGASGMGCGVESGGGFCTEDGDGVRIKVDEVADSGHHNLIQYNRLERIGYNGMDVFGPHNTIAYNVIQEACFSKGDCGGVRTFGSSNLNDTPVHDLSFDHNLILNTLGNTDGCIETYKPLFGFGLYIDHYSRDVSITGNTLVNATVGGILYQNSTGTVQDNVLYNNSSGSMYSAQVVVGGSPARLDQHSGNVLYALNEIARTLSASSGGGLASSDHNYFFHPYAAAHISAEGSKTLAEWQAYSGQDANSVESWFSLNPGEPPLSQIFYNDTSDPQTIDLGGTVYLDLDQKVVSGSLTLAPFTSQILIYSHQITTPDLSPSTKTVRPAQATAGQRVTYTLAARSAVGPMSHPVVVTDVLPAGLTYVPGSLRASSGTVDESQTPRLTWSGVLSPTPTAWITYAATVEPVMSGTATLRLPRSLSNLAQFSAPGYQTLSRSATLRVDWNQVYLPLILRP